MAPEKVDRGIRGDPKRNVADQAPPVRFEGIGSELTSQTQSRVQVLIVHGPENHAVDHASPCAQERQSIPEGAIQRTWKDAEAIVNRMCGHRSLVPLEGDASMPPVTARVSR